MKIGIVLPSTPGYSETFFRNKIKGLEKNGHSVTLFVNSKSFLESNFKNVVVAPNLSGSSFFLVIKSFYILFKSFIFYSKKVKKLYNLNKKDQFSFQKNLQNIVINNHFLSQKLDWLHFGFGTMALDRENVAKAIGAKIAVSFRGFDWYVYPTKNKKCYDLLFSKPIKYHVLSDGMKIDLMKFGINSKKIIKITPAIDLNLFSNIGEFELKQQLQIVTIARLHWIKGIEYTLQALALVKQSGIDFQYTIIGDGIEKERLEFAAHQLGLTENVTFTGKLNPEELKIRLQKSNLYLQYSLQEGFCNAVLEAQAMGLLCVVSDADGLQENIVHEITGFVVPKRNSELLAKKIIETTQLSIEKRNQFIKNAIARVKRDFNVANQIEEFVDFYKN